MIPSKTKSDLRLASSISSMFYDHELGEATYSSPAGEINGTILLKRQYRIRKGNMEYMIESSVTVHDDILQKELCSNADNKMRNIVTTIQREQNRIIRNENAPVLIISRRCRFRENICCPPSYRLPALRAERADFFQKTY